MKIESDIDNDVVVTGNKSLILSVFRILSRSCKLCWRGTTIKIIVYNEDKNFYHFSLSDNGLEFLRNI